MVLYSNGLTGSQIAAGVALSIINDININGLGLDGFPKIGVKRSSSSGFLITMEFETFKKSFALTEKEAHSIVKLAKEFAFDEQTFDRVQDCLANLEGQKRGLGKPAKER